MFWYGLFIGLIVGANISLFLYACIIAGARADKEAGYIEEMEGDEFE